MAGAVSDAANDANSVLGELSNSFKQLGIGDENLDKALDNIMGIVDGIGEIGEGIATGNPVAIVTGSIKLLTNAIDLFNTKDKKLQKQIDGYQKQLDALGKAYKQLERDISNSVGESFYDDSKKAIDNMNSQIAATQKMLDAERKKKKSDKGKIQDYENLIDDLKFKVEDAQKAISEMLLQTDFKAFSNNLASALLSAFEAGEDGIDAMDRTFDKFIKNAVTHAAQLKFIEPLIGKMFDEVAAYASSNDNSLLGFDFSKWRESLQGVAANTVDFLESAFKELGVEPESAGKDTLSKNIQGIKETTANRLEAEFGGLRLAQLQLLEVTRGQVAIMQQHSGYAFQNLQNAILIERNTFRTAENTEHLSRLANIETAMISMNSKIVDGEALRRGAGYQ